MDSVTSCAPTNSPTPIWTLGQPLIIGFETIQTIGTCIQLVTNKSTNFFRRSEKVTNWDPMLFFTVAFFTMVFSSFLLLIFLLSFLLLLLVQVSFSINSFHFLQSLLCSFPRKESRTFSISLSSLNWTFRIQ